MVVTSESVMEIRLENVKEEDIAKKREFLIVPFSDNPDEPATVEDTVDSSRYFVLAFKGPAKAGGKMFFMGLGFERREQATDFKLAIQEWQRMKAREIEAKLNPIKKLENTGKFKLDDSAPLAMKPFAFKKKEKKGEDDFFIDDKGGE